MAFYSSSLLVLAGGNQVWQGDAVPSGDTTIQPFQAGDYMWVTSPTAGLPAFYKCTTAPSSTTPDGIWQAASSVTTVKAVTAAYTALATDDTIIQSNGTGVAVTLPAASTVPNKNFTVKNNNGSTSNTVVVASTGAIDGGHTLTLGASYSAATLRSDGTQYWVVAAFSTVSVA